MYEIFSLAVVIKGSTIRTTRPSATRRGSCGEKEHPERIIIPVVREMNAILKFYRKRFSGG